MPKIRRWFPVSHDINGDPEVWVMRHDIGEKALSIWLELLSIADRNEGFLIADETPETSVSVAYQSLIRSVSGKCQVTVTTVSRVCQFAENHLWIACDPIPRIRNHAEYHRTRETKKNPQGDTLSSPLPNLPNLPNLNVLKDTSIYAAAPSEEDASSPTDDAKVLHLVKSDTPVVVAWPDDLLRVKEVLDQLGVEHPPLHDPKYWRAIDEWIDGTKLPIFYLDEFKAYMAHQASKRAGQKGWHKDLKAGFRNWLATAVRWKERDGERTQFRKQYQQSYRH